MAAGVETIDPAPGTSGGYGSSIIHADWTHSLFGALVLAALFGLVAARPWGRRVGVVLGAVVCSHWLLDLVVHRADLAILPGNAGGLPRLGLGLWEAPAASIVAELALVVAGSYLYWRAAVQIARSADEARRANLLGAVVLAAGSSRSPSTRLSPDRPTGAVGRGWPVPAGTYTSLRPRRPTGQTGRTRARTRPSRRVC